MEPHWENEQHKKQRNKRENSITKTIILWLRMHHTLCCPFTQFKKLPFFLCQRNEKLLLFVRHFSLDKTTFSNLISSTYSKITFICHFICRPLRVIIACRILAHGPNSYLNITRVWVRCIACCFRSIAKQVKEGEKAAQTKFPSPFYTENHSRSFLCHRYQCKASVCIGFVRIFLLWSGHSSDVSRYLCSECTKHFWN